MMLLYDSHVHPCFPGTAVNYCKLAGQIGEDSNHRGSRNARTEAYESRYRAALTADGGQVAIAVHRGRLRGRNRISGRGGASR